MNQKKKTVALLYGGRGAEHDVSVSGAKYLYSLIDRRYEVYPILIDRDGGYRLCADISDREGVPLRLCRGGFSTGENGFLPVDVAFPLLHGDYGEDGVLQGALECADIPFVGCRTHAGALCSDKAFTKLVAESLGIPTADWILSVEGSATQGKEASRRRAEIRLGYPMFIKPARLGSSIGALPVWRKEEFDRAYDEAAKLGGGRVIIEELVKVRSEL